MRHLVAEALTAFGVLTPTVLLVQFALGWGAQQATELAPLLDFLQSGGLPAFLLLALWGFMRGWWVFGREFADAKKWEPIALKALQSTERLVNVVEKAV